MRLLPRLAVGTVQPRAAIAPVLWALMQAMHQRGLQVQSFLAESSFAGYHGSAAATGIAPRHLDSWLMSPELCREAFVRGTVNCDLGIVEGQFTGTGQDDAGGRLETLCDWLDLPRVVVLDASQLEGCRLPARPEAADALLLDRVRDHGHSAQVATNLETVWGLPVLGVLPELPALRAAAEAVPAAARPPKTLCEQLARHFLRSSKLERLLRLAQRRPATWPAPRTFDSQSAASSVVVALASDAAFNCHFHDTLDRLEELGATIVDFSPLRDERLPPGTDVVYLPCGDPGQYAEELTQNHCMKLALRSHVCNGGRVYAEGGGLAYLCQHLEAPDGQFWRMVGIFSAAARLNRPPHRPTPVEVTLSRTTWLGPRGTRLRGYQNPFWRLEAVGPLAGCVAQPRHALDVVQVLRAVGSQHHLNFAAQPELLFSFFRCRLPQLEPGDPWTAVS